MAYHKPNFSLFGEKYTEKTKTLIRKIHVSKTA
jgi:hypothetical protein